MKIATAGAEWLLSIRSLNSRQGYSLSMLQFLRWTAKEGREPRMVGEITRSLAKEWQHELEARYGRKRTDGQYVQTSSSAATKFVALKSFLSFCEREGHVPINAAAGMRIPRSSQPRKAMPIENVRTLMRWSNEERGRKDLSPTAKAKAEAMHLCLIVLATTGLRITELVSLTAGDFASGSPATLTILGKGAKANRVILHGDTADAIRAYLSRHPRAGTVQLVAPAGREKDPIKTPAITRWLRQACDSAGIPRMSPHQFRSTLATELHLSGVGLNDIQRLLGHASTQTTARYVHLVDAERQSAALRIRVCPEGAVT